MARWLSWMAVIVTVCLVLAAACGSDDSADPPTPTPDATGDNGDNGEREPGGVGPVACDILTESDIAEATGMSLGPGEGDSDRWFTSCRYLAMPTGWVSISISTFETPEGALEFWPALDGGESVDGIADDARWWPGLGRLHALDGARNVQISALTDLDTDAGTPITFEEAVAMMEAALGRLP